MAFFRVTSIPSPKDYPEIFGAAALGLEEKQRRALATEARRLEVGGTATTSRVPSAFTASVAGVRTCERASLRGRKGPPYPAFLS